MGKRRNTAKTGDKALYKAREAFENDAKEKRKNAAIDDDPMYNDVDRFYNDREKEFLRLDGGSSSDDSDDDVAKFDAVMDLAAGGDVDSSDDESDSDNDNEQRTRKRIDQDKEDDGSEVSHSSDEEIEVSSSDDDNDDDNDDNDGNIRMWGSKKSAYYQGDDHDRKKGDDDEDDDAVLEEMAAKEVQAARYKNMSEEDFLLSDDDDDDKSNLDNKIKRSDTTSKESKGRTVKDNILKLSTREQRKVIEKHHPELLPLLVHFSGTVENLQNQSAVATRAIFESEEDNTAETVGTSKLGQQYLLTKTMLQSSAALNLAMYLLLKSQYQRNQGVDGSIDSTQLIQTHPVMSRLQKINSLLQQLEENVEQKVDGLAQQMENLVKAASLMTESNEVSVTSNDSDDDSQSSDKADDQSDSEEDDDDIGSTTVPPSDSKLITDANDSESSSNDSDPDELDTKKRRNVLTEARFGLRPNEVARNNIKQGQRNNRLKGALDVGDESDDDKYPNINNDQRRKRALQSLAKTVNSIEQRTASSKRRAAPLPEHVDYNKDDDEDGDGELRRGLEMMEAELGKMSDEEDKVGDGDSDGGESDNLDDDGDDFYGQVSKRSKTRKELRKEKYKVQPKFPTMDPEVDGERPISKQILKNRGLVAHKNKLNRNPRAKKREQYRKALIRRKGTVREVRTNEAHQYGGEETGIKRNISRSRKLAT